jgi:hypothetical protein
MNAFLAVLRLGFLTRLLLALAGFGICLSGTGVELAFGDSTLALVVAWALRVFGFLMAVLFFSTMATGNKPASRTSADEDEQRDLAHNYRIDNWNNTDYWGGSRNDLD